jgi:lipid A oxidase
MTALTVGKTARAMVALGVLAAVSVSGSAAMAQAELELSFYIGAQSAPHSTIDDSVLGSARVRWLGKSFESPPYYGARATWWVSEKWGFGVEANHAKVYAENKLALGYNVLEFTDGLNLVTANAFRRFPNKSRITPYVGAGIGISVPHVEIQRIGESRTFEYQLAGPAVILVAGASYAVNDSWSVFAEYKGSYSHNKTDVDAGGTLTTNIVTNAVNVGISYSF